MHSILVSLIRLTRDGQDENFNLPDTHTFQVLFDTQDFLELGGFIPEIIQALILILPVMSHRRQ